ncbi:MAG: hypothetical protein IPO63_12745 [Bacteroidetes bacterium]|nr:hypothetical protein [Bacteroidota bacterium]
MKTIILIVLISFVCPFSISGNANATPNIIVKKAIGTSLDSGCSSSLRNGKISMIPLGKRKEAK